MKHGFIILNYNSYEDCIKAVNSIDESFDNPHILIVDNCSNDDSYFYLEKYDKLFDLIKTPSNLGFGNGNNYGFNYMINKYSDLDYIHVLNPDIIIKDITKFSQKDYFYIMGPDVILNQSNKSSSPIRIYDKGFSIKKYVRAMKIYKFLYVILMLLFGRIINGRLEKKFLEFKSFNQSNDKVKVLSGCYLIFSKNYFNNVNYLFYKELFLYDEEVAMFYILDRLKMTDMVIYNDNIKVLHEHRATSNNWKNKVKNVEKNFKILNKLGELSDSEIKKMWLKGDI